MMVYYLLLISLLLESLSLYKTGVETIARGFGRNSYYAIIPEPEIHLKKRSA